jgi:uncharacterized membrane protein
MNDAASTDQGVRTWVHAMLGLILCLLSFNLFVFLRYGDASSFDRYGNLVVSLMLLFNHLAFQYTRTGWQSKVMKGVAVAWLAFAFVYTFWTVRW